MSPIRDHPLRYPMANELHARPFPSLDAPCFAAYLAVKPAEDAAGRDRGEDRAHLLALLDRFGAQHPKEGATHWFGEIGKYSLKWEQHTEFVTYTIFGAARAGRAFDGAHFDVFPADWLAEAPGARLTSALIRVEERPDDRQVRERLAEWFVPESLATSEVLEATALIASDFRIDESGHMRMVVFTAPEIGSRRTGRIVQRLCEIETYKSLSMLGLARVRELAPVLAGLDANLTRLMADMTGSDPQPENTLKALLMVSAELETILAQTSFRFGATEAYEALVNQRVTVLRESHYHGRQTLAEFMMRRFDPSMRTVRATRGRLRDMSERALRAGDLLRTQVDVARSAQNQDLLASMDRRADQQLRLQRTVEGLSVVAISYYAVSLAALVAAPLMVAAEISKVVGTAILTPIVIAGVWLMVRRATRSTR